MNQAAILTETIRNIPEYVDLWRVFAIASGIGPYLVTVYKTTDRYTMIKLFFKDGSEYHITPDGDSGRESNAERAEREALCRQTPEGPAEAWIRAADAIR